MGRVFDHIKGYAEQQVIDAMCQRREQRTTAARTIAQLYWADATADPASEEVW